VLSLQLEDLLLVLLQVGGATQVRAVVSLIHIISVVVVICKAIADEFLATITYLRLSWEHYLASIQDCLVFQDGLLWLVVTKGFRTKKKLVENYSYAPNVHFVGYLRRVLLETFWCLVPVSSDALRSQLDLFVSLVYYLAKTKVSNLNLSVMEDNILWLKVVVNNFLFALVQILEPTQDLRNYELDLLLWNLAVLFEIEIQIWSWA